MDQIEAAERNAIALKAGINSQYLYQCLTRRRDMDARQAAQLERVSNGRVRRWHLRRDWALVWPELIGADGAPTPVEATRDG